MKLIKDRQEVAMWILWALVGMIWLLMMTTVLAQRSGLAKMTESRSQSIQSSRRVQVFP